jgi:four helix bundle protein
MSNQFEGEAASMEASNRALETGQKKSIKSYRDLIVYNESYQASIIILTQILPKLPKEEQYDLTDQLRRSAKAIPRLIAEGYGKKHQRKGFGKYIDDAMAEANETSVSLCHCKDAYYAYVNPALCQELIATYDKIGKQLYRLGEAWENFYRR